MTDAAIIAASYAAEKSYTHNLDNVIDASDAVGAWGITKESTTELSDLSGNGNIADIHGAMPAEGFIQGRRFDSIDYIDCGNDSSLQITDDITLMVLVLPINFTGTKRIIDKDGDFSFRFNTNHLECGIFGASNYVSTSSTEISINTVHLVMIQYDTSIDNFIHLFIDGSEVAYAVKNDTNGQLITTSGNLVISRASADQHLLGIEYISMCINNNFTENDYISLFNTLARLPFWSVNYTDYPDNVTEYTDNLPYSSSIISSGTFKVDDDKLQCVSAGTITYSASYEFDGSEYIKVEIDGMEYAGTGTITQGNTTVSVAQGSNKVTIQAGTGDTIDKVRIQFRAEV